MLNYISKLPQHEYGAIMNEVSAPFEDQPFGGVHVAYEKDLNERVSLSSITTLAQTARTNIRLTENIHEINTVFSQNVDTNGNFNIRTSTSIGPVVLRGVYEAEVQRNIKLDRKSEDKKKTKLTIKEVFDDIIPDYYTNKRFEAKIVSPGATVTGIASQRGNVKGFSYRQYLHPTTSVGYEYISMIDAEDKKRELLSAGASFSLKNFNAAYQANSEGTATIGVSTKKGKWNIAARLTRAKNDYIPDEIKSEDNKKIKVKKYLKNFINSKDTQIEVAVSARYPKSLVSVQVASDNTASTSIKQIIMPGVVADVSVGCRDLLNVKNFTLGFGVIVSKD